MYNNHEITEFLFNQLRNIYTLSDTDILFVNNNIDTAIKRTLTCFSHIKNKYYNKNSINYLHGGQYTIFLYFLCNTIYCNEIKNKQNYNDFYSQPRVICDKIYGLNKLLSSCDLFYEVVLPDYFFFDHPFSSVIGRGTISNGFCFSQGCTIGNNNGIYPVLGENVFMNSNSKILGDCHIGKNVIISANTYIKDTDIPDNVIVFGQSPNLIIKHDYEEKVIQIVEHIFIQ